MQYVIITLKSKLKIKAGWSAPEIYDLLRPFIYIAILHYYQWRSQPNSDARAQIFTHNVTTCLDAGPTFMKAQKIMHIQYNLS